MKLSYVNIVEKSVNSAGGFEKLDGPKPGRKQLRSRRVGNDLQPVLHIYRSLL